VVSRLIGAGGGGEACTQNISPSRLIIRHEGEMATISVTASAGCEWTATSTLEWITFPSGATGAGSGTLTVSVGPRPRRSWIPRFGVIIVAGRTILVIQD
jgi:hypothetical protein